MLEPAIPPLLQTSGKMKFHEQGIRAEQCPLDLPRRPGRRDRRQPARRRHRDPGRAARSPPKACARHYPTPAMQRLLAPHQRRQPLHRQINVRDQQPDIVVDSALAGLALDFPAPLQQGRRRRDAAALRNGGQPSAQPARTARRTAPGPGPRDRARYSRRKADDATPMASGARRHRRRRAGAGAGQRADAQRRRSTARCRRLARPRGGDGRQQAGRARRSRPAARPALERLACASTWMPDTLAARATELVIVRQASWTTWWSAPRTEGQCLAGQHRFAPGVRLRDLERVALRRTAWAR